MYGQIGYEDVQGTITAVLSRLQEIAKQELETLPSVSINKKTVENKYREVQQKFVLETVYFGNSKSAGVTVAFYDKKEEQQRRNPLELQKEEALCCLEVRYVFTAEKNQSGKMSTWRETCLALLGYRDIEARNERCHYFFLEAFKQFEFTVKTRVSYEKLREDYANQIAPFSKHVKQAYVKAYASMYFNKELEESQTYMLLKALAPAGQLERNSCYFSKDLNQWISSFDQAWIGMFKALPIILPKAKEAEIIPVMKESDHFLYNLLTQSGKQVLDLIGLRSQK